MHKHWSKEEGMKIETPICADAIKYVFSHWHTHTYTHTHTHTHADTYTHTDTHILCGEVHRNPSTPTHVSVLITQRISLIIFIFLFFFFEKKKKKGKCSSFLPVTQLSSVSIKVVYFETRNISHQFTVLSAHAPPPPSTNFPTCPIELRPDWCARLSEHFINIQRPLSARSRLGGRYRCCWHDSYVPRHPTSSIPKLRLKYDAMSRLIRILRVWDHYIASSLPEMRKRHYIYIYIYIERERE